MKTSQAFIWRILLAAVVAAAAVSLSACTVPWQKASVKTVTVSGLSLPEVSGFFGNDDINDALADCFAPYAQQMQNVTDASDGKLSVVYTMKLAAGSSDANAKYRMSMNLTDGKENLEVASAVVSGWNTVALNDGQDLSWLSSADVAETALVLRHVGMDIDFAGLQGSADERFTVETFVKLYEAFAGKELDVSDITVGEDDALYKKALKLGIITAYGGGEYEFDTSSYVYQVENGAEAVMRAVERDVYGRQSETVTGQEWADIIHTFYMTISPQEAEDSPYLWSAMGEVDVDAILEDTGMKDQPLTRRDGAELVVRMMQKGPKYSMKYRDNGLNFIDDSDNIWVRRAVTHGFMNYYGDSVLFAPDEGLTVTNAIANARTYVMTRFNDWSYAVNYVWDGNYSQSDVVLAAGRVARYFDSRSEEDKKFEVKTVINDRDYDWFFSQKNTGDYSGVNCMPSIATMASHWYDQNSTATVKKMRATSGSTEGWTAYELRDGLDAYKVPYQVENHDLASITKALDEGKIILAQYSDRPYEMTGHCYVIYGYRQFKNSTTFIINDSDSLSYRAEIFGRQAGNGDELEANFSLWSIQRFVSDVTVVG